MSLRMTLTAALGLALALPALADAKPTGRRGESASQDSAVTRVVYPVAELVVPIDYGDGRACDQTLEGRLMELIKTSVAPKSWQDQGGAGTLEYVAQGMFLTVNQSREAQGEVADLLAALRRLQDVEVAVEVRVVHLSPEMAARFLLKAGFEAGKADAVAKFVGITTFGEALGVQCPPKVEKVDKVIDTAILTGKELYPWFQLFQTDPATNIVQAPKITMANGQRAKVMVPGLEYTLLPKVGADYRSVRLQVNLQCVQQPQVETIVFKQTNIIPDGRTMAVSLGQIMSEARTESTVPVLSKIPYVSRLFRSVGAIHETREAFLFVTPRVIVQGEAEQIIVNPPRESFVPTLPPIARP
jgi:hypothetical protein